MINTDIRVHFKWIPKSLGNFINERMQINILKFERLTNWYDFMFNQVIHDRQNNKIVKFQILIK